jgi:pyrroline-5-carboxylate reductase
MKLQKDNILIVGAGNMGFAFITALLDTKVAAKQISVLENNPSQELKKLTKLKKLNLISSIAMLDIKKKISIVLLAIKPNQVNNIFTDDFNIRINKSLLISIVAGKTMASLKKLSNGNINIARAMTNTPVTVGWGTSIVYFSKNFSVRNKQKVIHLFDLVGQVEEVKNEKYINTFTALF